jgi:hypothetical protein
VVTPSYAVGHDARHLAFDDAGNLLTPFRTWRNTNTGPATEVRSDAFGYNIP